MRLSKEEQELIEKHRADKKNKEDANAPKFVGYAKQDLYSIGTDVLKETFQGVYGWYLTKKEIDAIVVDAFDVAVPAGTEFHCYVRDGVESWYDTFYGIEDMDSDWAREYLKGIKPFVKKIIKSKR